jgi:hypothetical protein
MTELARFLRIECRKCEILCNLGEYCVRTLGFLLAFPGLALHTANGPRRAGFQLFPSPPLKVKA